MSVRRLGLGPPLGWATVAILVALSGHLVSSAPTPYPNSSGSMSDCVKEASRAIFPVLRFIATNFIAHAFTIKLSPGFGIAYTLMFCTMSLFFPYFGLVGAVRNIERLAAIAESPLESASKSGALCALARTRKWKPRPGEKAWCWSKRDPPEGGGLDIVDHHGLGMDNLPRRFTKLHGMCHPPRCVNPKTGEIDKDKAEEEKEQYMLVRLPPYYAVHWNPNPRSKECLKFQVSKYNNRQSLMEKLEDCLMPCCRAETAEGAQLSEYDIGVSSSLGLMKGIIALFQLYSIVNYIRAEKGKGNIEDYAAFQLTLIPYGLMSVVNILCGLVTPSYPGVYMVDSTIMEEARNRGWIFDGTVGKLCENTEDRDGCSGSPKPSEGGARVGLSEEGGTNAPPSSNNDRIREIGAKPSPGVNESEAGVGEPNTGSKGEVKLTFKIFTNENIQNKGSPVENIPSRGSWFPETIGLHVRLIVKEILPELFLIRLVFSLHEKDPGKEYAKLLLDSEKEGTAEDSTTPIPVVVLPIGNPTYRKGSWWRFPMLVISDLIVLVSLALPYVITWGLTGFKAPSGGKLYGAVFLAWLVLGQLSPVPARVVWGFIQSRQRKSKELILWYIFVILCCTGWSAPAMWGFILVGKEKYRHPDGGANIG